MKRKILIKDNFLNVSSLNDAGGFLDRLCKDIFRSIAQLIIFKF